MPAKVVLKVTSGPIKGKVFDFVEHDTFLFGRHRTCHARLPDDDLVSRHHFMLEANPPNARLRDLGSRNGTYVNRVKYGGRTAQEDPKEAAKRAIPEVDLRDGDAIQVGKTTIEVQIVSPPVCRDCGNEIADDELDGAEEQDAGYACASCQALVETKDPVSSAVINADCCERCGKELALEDGAADSGQRVCDACQSELMSDRLHGLMTAASSGLLFEDRPQISGHTLGDELGKGAMGCVYKATRDSDALPVAVKIAMTRVTLSQAARDRFEREIQVVRSLRDHHITRLMEHGIAEGKLFLVVEYCNGGNLDELRERQGGALPLATAAPIMLQCLSGLEYAHANGVVHRDLKPQNILLHQYQDKWIAKIADFGLAKSYANAGYSGMTATGTGGGTYPYMPREQLTEFKYVKPCSDIWGIAATFYKLLTGSTPRDCPTGKDPISVILNEDAVPILNRNADIAAGVAEVIDRALQTEIEDRYQTVSDMKAALGDALRRHRGSEFTQNPERCNPRV